MNCMEQGFSEFVAQLLQLVKKYDSAFHILFTEGKKTYRLIVDRNRWNKKHGYFGTLTFQTLNGTTISSVTVYAEDSELLKEIKTKIYIFRRKLKGKKYE